MAKGLKILFVCGNCGADSPKWSGKCLNCGQWNSLVETKVSTKNPNLIGGSPKRRQKSKSQAEVLSLAAIPSFNVARLTSGFSEFDRTLGGGFVPGQVVLLAGEPGIGKSTLLLQVAEAIAKENPKSEIRSPKEIRNPNGLSIQSVSNFDIRDSDLTRRVLYVAGEESPLQVKQRAERLGIGGAAIEILPSTDVDEIIGILGSLNNLSLLIVDSIQTLTTSDVPSSAGSVVQVKECARRLTAVCKELNLPAIFIGHVNKEGDIAGPKVLEHIVDSLLYLEGERTLPFRILRAVKNRFGDPSEVGVWENSERGFREVLDPSRAFIHQRGVGPGSVLTVAIEGNRPIVLEVQALTVKTSLAYPRRVANGFDPNRLLFIIAVLERHLNLPLQAVDIYVNVTGGIKINETAADLAAALAVTSSLKSVPLRSASIAFGEVGLTAEIRAVSLTDRRLREAERQGFKLILSPSVKTLKEAVAQALAG